MKFIQSTCLFVLFAAACGALPVQKRQDPVTEAVDSLINTQHFDSEVENLVGSVKRQNIDSNTEKADNPLNDLSPTSTVNNLTSLSKRQASVPELGAIEDVIGDVEKTIPGL